MATKSQKPKWTPPWVKKEGESKGAAKTPVKKKAASKKK
jgi:hypothetical protein